MRPKVLTLPPCWRHVKILLPHGWIATNTGGSMFGGFQACLADPIAAMACIKVFPGYSVWTRSLHLDFKHQGLTDLELHFEMLPEQEEQIRQELKQKGRKAFIAYVPFGFPNTKLTSDICLSLERGGADIIELGLPFTDP